MNRKRRGSISITSMKNNGFKFRILESCDGKFTKMLRPSRCHLIINWKEIRPRSLGFPVLIIPELSTNICHPSLRPFRIKFMRSTERQSKYCNQIETEMSSINQNRYTAIALDQNVNMERSVWKVLGCWKLIVGTADAGRQTQIKLGSRQAHPFTDHSTKSNFFYTYQQNHQF